LYIVVFIFIPFFRMGIAMALSFCICYLCISLFDLMENIVFTALSGAFLISVSIKYEVYYPVSNITAIIRFGLK